MISKVVCMLITDVKTHLLKKCGPLRPKTRFFPKNLKIIQNDLKCIL